MARDTSTASKRDWWLATSKAVQSIVVERMIATATANNDKNAKRVYYLSLEFLMGRLFSNSLYNAGVFRNMVQALEELGLDYEELREEEYDMGLGNGGLGRLAACFLDSLATLDLPAIGYGIHYQYGLFKQKFVNGYRSNSPTHGCNTERLGKSSDPSRPRKFKFMVTSRTSSTTEATTSRAGGLEKTGRHSV